MTSLRRQYTNQRDNARQRLLDTITRTGDKSGQLMNQAADLQRMEAENAEYQSAMDVGDEVTKGAQLGSSAGPWSMAAGAILGRVKGGSDMLNAEVKKKGGLGVLTGGLKALTPQTKSVLNSLLSSPSGAAAGSQLAGMLSSKFGGGGDAGYSAAPTGGGLGSYLQSDGLQTPSPTAYDSTSGEFTFDEFTTTPVGDEYDWLDKLGRTG